MGHCESSYTLLLFNISKRKIDGTKIFLKHLKSPWNIPVQNENSHNVTAQLI